MFKILVVEDDANTRRFIEAVLLAEQYVPLLARNGEEALEVIDKQHVDLMITDIMMPGVDGYALTEQLRDAGYDLPILMVSAKETTKDKRRGFLIGTDDYMTKPFDDEEMVLRIKALLRRAKIVSEKKLTIGHTVLHYNTLTIAYGSKLTPLPQKEFYVLYKLLSYPETIFTRMQLMDEIWGMDSQTDEHTVSVHISKLRNRFYNWPDFEIVTVRGLGYKAVLRGE